MKILRQLSNEPDNKKCMDCGIKGTVYVCSNFNTFICTACSGLHRELNHRVKSISMTTFKPEEIKNLQQGGNAVARRKWLARWSPEDFPEPDPSDAQRVKAFMKLKYIDKRWYSETGEGPQPSSSSSYGAPHSNHSSAPAQRKNPDPYPQPVPLTTILGNDIPPLHINGSTNKQPAAQHQPHPPQANSAQNNNLVDWNAKAPASKPKSDLDDLLSIPDTTQQQAYQHQLQQQQHQNMYQQQQQLVMSQFGAQQQGWGGAPQGYFNPYGQGFGQAPHPHPQPGFFGGVQTPPNFFAPPPAGQGGPNPYGAPPAVGGSISPAFGQPGGQPAASPYGLSPSPTPASQPNAFGSLSPATVQPPFPHGGAMPPNQFGAALSPAPAGFGGHPAQQPNAFGGSPAQPANAFAGSPALHATGAFGGSPAMHSTPGGFGAQPQPTPAHAPQQPAADKFDIFASLSPLNAANASASKPSFPASSASHSKPPASNPSVLNTNTHTSANNPNPFGDPFGGSLQPSSQSQPAHAHAQPAHSQPTMNSDPFGGGFGTSLSPSMSAKPAPTSNNSDPFGFGATPSPSKPAPPPNNSDPFGFGAPAQQQPQHQQHQHQQQQQQHHQANNANPFGDDPFGGAPVAAQSSSAFSPYNANPFGGQPPQQQQQQQQHQQQQQQADPWGANPFF
jgi:hypothetical protein